MARRISEQERLGRRCSNCGAQGTVLARGLCGPCYYWVQSHGTPRPPEVALSSRIKPLRPCSSCGRLFKPLARGLCRACYARWHQSGLAERVRKPVAEPPTPPPPEDLLFHTLEEGPPPRWPGREVTGPPGPRQEEARRLLSQAGLAERERYVLEQLYGLDGGGRRQVGELGVALRLSRERVRQLQHEALNKVRRVYAAQNGPPREAPGQGGAEGAVTLDALAKALRVERALVGERDGGEPGARTWEAGVLRGLRIGKQAAYDVALGLVEDLRAGKSIES